MIFIENIGAGRIVEIEIGGFRIVGIEDNNFSNVSIISSTMSK